MSVDSAEPLPPGDITALLAQLRRGEGEAEQQLVEVVYTQLRALAASRLHGDRAGRTLGPTALVHEAWLRLGLRESGFDDRRHFFGAASRVMRQVLVDRHRRQHRQKREHQAAEFEAIEQVAAAVELPSLDLLALDEALTALEAMDPRMAEIVQLRYFAGLSVDEAAAALGVSPRTVKREWAVARLWLFQRIRPAARD